MQDRGIQECGAINTLPLAGLTDPHRVGFSQECILAALKDGRSIKDLAAALRSGEIEPREGPPIRRFERHGVVLKLDNRRLWALRQAGIAIPYRMATPEEIRDEAWKLTTKSGGTSVRVKRKR